MRRAERLFHIVQLIRGRRLSTAAFLAERLQVSPRTVYRDVADLQAQSVPIDREARVGYRMRSGFDLPPLMFTPAEAQALVAAVRIASAPRRGAGRERRDRAGKDPLGVAGERARRSREPGGVRAAGRVRAGYAAAAGALVANIAV